jgi:hypothetical protein
LLLFPRSNWSTDGQPSIQHKTEEACEELIQGNELQGADSPLTECVRSVGP